MSETPCVYFNICGNSLTFKKLPCQKCQKADCARCDACCGDVSEAQTLLKTAGVPNYVEVVERALCAVSGLPPTVLRAIRLQDELQPLMRPHLKSATLLIEEARDRSGYLSPRNEKRLRAKLARKKGRQP
jgi:hypothetical protein